MKGFTMASLDTSLPEYVVINDPASKKREVLQVPAEKVTFPLDPLTRKIIQELEAKFDQEDNCGGLAAPQIGYGKRIIILALEEDENRRNFRPYFLNTLPKSIWINPSFAALSSEKTKDWEACFSVDNLIGCVPRFTDISYEAWAPDGTKVQGKASGFLARLIQHEIDHINGILFIDYIPTEELITREEFSRNRKRFLSEQDN